MSIFILRHVSKKSATLNKFDTREYENFSEKTMLSHPVLTPVLSLSTKGKIV